MNRHELSAKVRQSGAGRWFYGKEPNEQRIVLGVGLLVIVSVLWAGVWKPVADWRALEQNRQLNAQSLYDWLRANERAAKAAVQAQGAQRGGNRSLIPVITRAAAAQQIKVNSLKPEANGVIGVNLEQQSFNKIMTWIAQLEENNGVSVQRISIDGEDAPGYVNAQIRLN